MARKASEKSIYRVAKQLGVSIATVSRVVNNRIGVSEATRRKVLECVQQMGYRASCGIMRQKYVAIINFYPVPTEYNRKLLETLFLHFRGKSICCSAFYYDFEKEQQTLLQRLRDEQYSGAILITPPQHILYQLHDFCDSEIPVMLVDHCDDSLPEQFGYIGQDSYETAYTAVKYLLSLGHQNIAYLGGNPGIPAADAYCKGYQDTMTSAGLPILTRINDFCGNLEDIASRETRELLVRHPEITAILAKDDDYALGAIHCADQMKIRVPEQLSVIGTGNYNFSAYTNPSITTMIYDLDELGEKIATQFAECLIHLPPMLKMPRSFIQSHLIVRSSTGAPRNGRLFD